MARKSKNEDHGGEWLVIGSGIIPYVRPLRRFKPVDKVVIPEKGLPLLGTLNSMTVYLGLSLPIDEFVVGVGKYACRGSCHNISGV